MSSAPLPRGRLRAKRALMGVLGLSTLLSGCALAPSAVADNLPDTALSPVPELVAPRDAWALAEAFVREHPGSEAVVGSGDSMLPLYRDRTVLVLRPARVAELRPTMTVVFIGDHGWPVAHVLTEHTAHGWRAIGLGNRECDLTLVRYDNLIGVVVKAYTPAMRSMRSDVTAVSLPLVGAPPHPARMAILEPREGVAGAQ